MPFVPQAPLKPDFNANARYLPLIRFLCQASQPLGDAARALAQTAGSCGRRRRGAGVPVQWGGAELSLGAASCKRTQSGYRIIAGLQLANAHPKSHNTKVLEVV